MDALTDHIVTSSQGLVAYPPMSLLSGMCHKNGTIPMAGGPWCCITAPGGLEISAGLACGFNSIPCVCQYTETREFDILLLMVICDSDINEEVVFAAA